MINIFCVRPTGFNIGNEAISFAVRHLLRDAFDAPVNLITVPAVEVDGQGWHSGLRARTVHEMNLYGHGVVVGGGNLYENGKLDVDMQAVRRLRPPLLLCGLSHGRIYDHRKRLTARTDAMPDEIIMTLNQVASESVVRDQATLDHLAALGITDAFLGGCPTLALGEMLREHHPNVSADGALISLRSPELMSVPLADQARVREELLSIVKVVESQGLGPVKLLCHDKRDMSFAASLGAAEYILPDDAQSYFDLLRTASVVVSFRLHAFLPCLSFGVPCVNISYDERSLSLVKTVGMGEWDIDMIKEVDTTSAVMDRVSRLQDFNTLLARSEPPRAKLIGRLKERIRAFAEDVLHFMTDQEQM